MLGWVSMAERGAAAGAEFTPYRSMRRWPDNLSLDDGWERADQLLHGEATRGDILAEAGAFSPDVLVLDCMMGAGFAAAQQLGLPTAVITHLLYSAFVSGWGDQVMHASVLDLLAATDRVLALVPPGFDAPVPLPANTIYVGPITHPESGQQPDGMLQPDLEMIARSGDPWVLLSLSTTLQRQQETLPAILAALESLPVRVMLTLGGAVRIETVVAPANVTVRDFVAHHKLLPHMSAVICHGGLSTITAALAAGVPIVCIPQGRDQPINAARVKACGVGRVIAPEASAAEIATEVKAVLADGTTRSSARRLEAEIRALGAGELATVEVERLATAHASHFDG